MKARGCSRLEMEAQGQFFVEMRLRYCSIWIDFVSHSFRSIQTITLRMAKTMTTNFSCCFFRHLLQASSHFTFEVI